MAPHPSPFLDPGTCAANDTLGIIQLRRDHLIPAVLSSTTDSDYAEGKVENTRFGSFPHSTLINQPWGTQILASAVDTGSRGQKGKKRKREKDDEGDATPGQDAEESRRDLAKAVTASSGFAHLIPPTPETWTLSLPHRTQVVYTPDYSYILQRLRVRPGDHIIEAGAGSGSFTHAAVRSVFNGYSREQAAQPPQQIEDGDEARIGITMKTRKRLGHVYSFEFHKPRAEQLKAELEEHGLGALVTVTNRDVYHDGFCVPAGEDGKLAPDADVIFLDLPSPWLALKKLTRSLPSQAVLKAVSSSDPSTPSADTSATTPQLPAADEPFRSPLNPKGAIRICTFSPCIEQVTKTVSAMRSLGWLEIDMVEIMAKRLEVRRERIGLQEEGLRGANPSPASVHEAVQRLRDVEGRAHVFHSLQKEKQEVIMRRAEAKKRGEKVAPLKEELGDGKQKVNFEALPPSKHDRLERAKKDLEKREIFKEGRLVHRTESEIKTHTSYLVFAVLPREWSKEEEEKARKKWS
ncbi:tRNA methyltransferase complex GCD14 subunit [Amniculicola lignicola CBS 123094]|uniref:tRNA (adenine(58)-N(1))-methyltransferase catalytic subunit TRM61 n=1 Tax=Amniculicola lignicola CBS 123094 TaxID=1392246 RepID=A0A6A5W560_9PLEO|nr:tRNA methyltransferase complex GCD14 subunit [Amniculicola lignicola CBS 123094]